MTYEEMFWEADECLNELEESLYSIKKRYNLGNDRFALNENCCKVDLLVDKKIPNFLYAGFLAEGMYSCVRKTFEEHLNIFNITYRLDRAKKEINNLIEKIETKRGNCIELLLPDVLSEINGWMEQSYKTDPDSYIEITGHKSFFNLNLLQNTIDSAENCIDNIYTNLKNQFLYYCNREFVGIVPIDYEMKSLFYNSFANEVRNSQEWIVQEINEKIINFKEKLHGNPKEDDWEKMYDIDMEACKNGYKKEFEDNSSIDDVISVGEREDIYLYYEMMNRVNNIANSKKYFLFDLNLFYKQGFVEDRIVLEEYSLSAVFCRIHRLNLIKIGMNPKLKKKYEDFLGFQILLPEHNEITQNSTNKYKEKVAEHTERKSMKCSFRGLINEIKLKEKGKTIEEFMTRLHELIDGSKPAEQGHIICRALIDNYIMDAPNEKIYNTEFTEIRGTWEAKQKCWRNYKTNSSIKRNAMKYSIF